MNLALAWITELCRMAFWTSIKYYHYYILTTAGEGTWMLGTDRGRTWLAKWHRTTPSVRAAPRSLGSDTFNRDSIFCEKRTWTHKSKSCFQLFHSAEHFIRGGSICITTLSFLKTLLNSFLSNTPRKVLHSTEPELNTIWEQLSSMTNSFHCTAQATNATFTQK